MLYFKEVQFQGLYLCSTLIGNVPLTQLCTRLSGICIADELKDTIFESHSTDNGILNHKYFFPCTHLHFTDNVLDGLAINLLLTQSRFVNSDSWKFANDQVKSLMEQQHLMEFDK